MPTFPIHNYVRLSRSILSRNHKYEISSILHGKLSLLTRTLSSTSPIHKSLLGKSSLVPALSLPRHHQTDNLTAVHFSTSCVLKSKMVTMHFVKEGTKEKLTTHKAKVGSTFREVIMDADLDVEGYGACEGIMACVTCHLIFSEENFKKLAIPASLDELDMLDLAVGLQPTSRLGCQVEVEPWMDGLEVIVPAERVDARSG